MKMKNLRSVFPLAILLCSITSCGPAPLSPQTPIDLPTLSQHLASCSIVLVGERHSLVEPVQTVESLLSSAPADHRFSVLALEWPQSEQHAIDSYLSGDDDILKRMEQTYASTPGTTVEYFSLFGFVRDHNRRFKTDPIAVYCIDVNAPVRSTAEEARDQHMFDRLKSLLHSSPHVRVLAYVGSAHAVKLGTTGYRRADGAEVQLPTLGALLNNQYGPKCASICMLSDKEPVRAQLNEAHPLSAPAAYRPDASWTNPTNLLSISNWRPPPSSDVTSVNQLFDYVIDCPTSTAAHRFDTSP
jgi:erythromycin esterase-like protein